MVESVSESMDFIQPENLSEKSLCDRISLLCGGLRTVLFNSGMNAVIQTVLTLSRTGDEIISSGNINPHLAHVFSTILRDMGIIVKFINSSDWHDFDAAISFRTRFIFVDIEGAVSPETMNIKKLAEAAHRNRIPLVADQGRISPEVKNALKYGADIAILDFKRLFADGSVSGGAVTERGGIDWRILNVPILKAEDPCWNNIRWAFDLADNLAKTAFSLRLENVMKRVFNSGIPEADAEKILKFLDSENIQ